MGAAIGVVVGYLMGARAGEKGYEQLVDAWDTIRTSEEVRDILASGLMLARELAGRAAEMLAGGSPRAEDVLRRVA
jgi:hypothetical protein